MKFFHKIFNKELPFIFASPALIWQLLFLYFPLIWILIVSFSTYQDNNCCYRWTLSYYKEVFNSEYLIIIFNSFILASITTLCCLIIAYPVAYFLTFKVRQKFRTIFLFALILPSWTNFIVQIYAWFFLLEKGGLFSKILYNLGLTSTLPNFLNSFYATCIGMIYCFLPFMIFPIYTVLEKMDKRLIEASADLGASRYETFRHVIFPLSFSGVSAGCILVFIPAFAEFVIPILLGGSRRIYWGSVIVQKILIAKDWASGFAYSCLGVIFIICLLILIFIIQYIYRVFSGQEITFNEPVEEESTNIEEYWE